MSGTGWSRKVVKTFHMPKAWYTNTSESNLKLSPSLSSSHCTPRGTFLGFARSDKKALTGVYGQPMNANYSPMPFSLPKGCMGPCLIPSLIVVHVLLPPQAYITPLTRKLLSKLAERRERWLRDKVLFC